MASVRIFQDNVWKTANVVYEADDTVTYIDPANGQLVTVLCSSLPIENPTVAQEVRSIENEDERKSAHINAVKNWANEVEEVGNG